MALIPATLTGNVVDRQNPAYPAARMDFNARLQFHPRVIVFCASPSDVQRAVRWSRAHRLPLRARNGRHSYEGFSLVDGGVVIDVSAMNQVVLDKANGTATIGAGATLGKVYDALWDQGRVTIPGGGCTGVGVTGLTLGGGFGFLTRLMGLTCDSLLRAEMVGADGDIITVDADANADLLWASRGGGGGNFGIVTSLVFRVHPIDNVTVFSISWPWEDIRTVFEAFQTWGDPETLDQRLVPILSLPGPKAGGFTALGEFVGPFAELDQLLQPLVQAARPADMTIVTKSYIDAVHHFTAPAAGPGMMGIDAAPDATLDKFKNTSAFQYQVFGQAAIDTMIAQLERAPTANDLVQFNLHGGQEAAVPDDATAYPHRQGVRCSLQYQAYWSREAEGPEQMRWVEGFRRAMLPYTRGAYVNYCDLDIADWPTAYYGPNLDRLLATKASYDPDNVFDFPQGLGRVRP